MVKQTIFITLNAIAALAIGLFLFYGVFRTSENAVVHSIYQGGPLVVVLIMIFIMLLIFVVERYMSLYKVAKGQSSVQVFFKKLVTMLQ